MFTQAERDYYRAQFEYVLDTLGVPCVWMQAKAPNSTADILAGFKTLGPKDGEIANGYSVGDKVLTVKTKDVALIEKFDRFVFPTLTLTADEVVPIHINGEHIFWKMLCRGK